MVLAVYSKAICTLGDEQPIAQYSSSEFAEKACLSKKKNHI